MSEWSLHNDWFVHGIFFSQHCLNWCEGHLKCTINYENKLSENMCELMV